MTSGQMLLAGFNGLFTKVASELTDMFATFEQVRLEKHELKFDVIRDAQDLQVTGFFLCIKYWYVILFSIVVCLFLFFCLF